MNQHGVTFLEIIVVVAILMIVTSLVSPGIGDWRQRQALDSDFYAVLSKIEYLKIRARVLNGTAVLRCQPIGKGSALTYQVFDKPQTDFSVPTTATATLLEDPSQANPTFNILSGRTKINSTICAGNEGVFLSSGQSSLKGGSGQIELLIEPLAGKEKFGSYDVFVRPSTGFIEKYKCIGGNLSQCKELE